MMAGGGRLALLALLARGDGLSRAALEGFRDAQLRRLVAHAAERVPYYRRLFDRHGVRPETIRTAADLGRLPMVSRADLQGAAPEDVVARGCDPARLITHRTSGSSGRPLAIRRTWLEERMYSLLRYRALRRLGLRTSDRRVYIGLLRPVHARNSQALQRLLRAAGLFRRQEIDCRRPATDILATLRRLQPDVVTGYPGVLSRIAGQLTSDDRRRLPTRLVLTGAEVLTPLVRRHIAEAFGALVLETYASYEAPALAWQCAATGAFHVAEEGVILEVIADGRRPAQPGEAGEVVVTALHSFAMPFIRYRLGDLVTRGETPCRCGAQRATIQTIQGRMLDYFPLANGRTVHPLEIISVISDSADRWLAQYQLTQERPDHLVMRVVPKVAPLPAELEQVEALVLAAIGPGITLELRLVREIELDANGKFRLSRSLLAAPDGCS